MDARVWGIVVDSFAKLLIPGITVTIPLTLISFALGLILAIVVALVRVAKVPVASQIAWFYIWVFRGTPLLVQLFVIFFGLPSVGITIPALPSAVIAFSLNVGAYAAETLRGAILAVPKGQLEAGLAANMPYVTIMRRIILPQVIRIILPPISNETITLVKDTSLVYVLAMNDLMRTARNLVQRDFSITPFIVAAVFYLIATLILTVLFERLEKHFSRYEQ